VLMKTIIARIEFRDDKVFITPAHKVRVQYSDQHGNAIIKEGPPRRLIVEFGDQSRGHNVRPRESVKLATS